MVTRGNIVLGEPKRRNSWFYCVVYTWRHRTRGVEGTRPSNRYDGDTRHSLPRGDEETDVSVRCGVDTWRHRTRGVEGTRRSDRRDDDTWVSSKDESRSFAFLGAIYTPRLLRGAFFTSSSSFLKSCRFSLLHYLLEGLVCAFSSHFVPVPSSRTFFVVSTRYLFSYSFCLLYLI